MVHEIPAAIISGTERDIRAVARMDDDVDSLYKAIVTHLGHLANKKLTDEQTHRVQDALYIANYIENMADVIETNMVTAGLHRAAMGVSIGAATRDRLLAMVERVEAEVALALESVETWDPERARGVIADKPAIWRLSTEAGRYLITRLGAAEPARGEAYGIESDLVESLKRIFYLARRIAKVVAGVDETPEAPADEERIEKKEEKKRKKKKKDRDKKAKKGKKKPRKEDPDRGDSGQREPSGEKPE